MIFRDMYPRRNIRGPVLGVHWQNEGVEEEVQNIFSFFG